MNIFKCQTAFIKVLLLLFLFSCQYYLIVDASKVEIFENNSTLPTYYEVSTPPFDLGNLSFPISAPAIFSYGCSPFSHISEEKITSAKQRTNSDKFIVFVEASVNENGCFQLQRIFECQQRDWCIGLFIEDAFNVPAGLYVWSFFDKPRPRSAYGVPMVQASKSDFAYFKNLILSSESENKTYEVTLTHDPNKWVDMFQSPIFLLYFRILSPIWSFGCIVLIMRIFSKRKSLSAPDPRKYSRSSSRNNSRAVYSRVGVKEICLVMHFITHLSRVGLFVTDPFLSQQIFPYLASNLFLTLSLGFETATDMLLAFVIRELTRASKALQAAKKLKLAYGIVFSLLCLDFFVGVLDGQKKELPNFKTIYVLAFYYIFTNVALGIWYFWQGFKFLRACAEVKNSNKKTDHSRNILIRISMINSIGMITMGLLIVLIIIRSIYGVPWGYFGVMAAMTLVVQGTSFFKILLFGDVVFSKEKIFKFSSLLRKPKSADTCEL
eukprot:c20670_g2_i1.p1 GENE.c20670_g2_i1~~c20670_g2_i1.p1  ORF type:complete len:493 (-),score=116.55 c20670_g2_i1:125-1603(-)